MDARSGHLRSRDRPFLQTLPGILTGVAAIITAVGALVAVVVRDGGDQSQPPPNTVAQSGPDEGRVARATIAWERNGPASLSISGPAKEVWARFVFGALPAPGRRIMVKWQKPDGSSAEGVAKERTAVVVARYVEKRPLQKGRWHVFLHVDDQIVKDLPFRVTGSSEDDEPIMSAG